VALLIGMAFGSTFWVFGLFFHLIGLLVRVALVTAVVALVWRRFAHGRRHRSRM
jgi:hypothetical protein